MQSYLSIYISHDFVCANLAFNGRVFNDKSYLSENLKEQEMVEFWLSYFRTLEKKWGASFLDTSKISKDSFNVSFKNIGGCKVSVLKTNINHKQIVGSLRKFSLDIKILSYTRELNEDLLKSFASTLEYEDVVLLDLNTRFFKASRVEKIGGEFKTNLSKIFLPEYRYVDSRIYFSEIPPLLRLLKGSKYKNFLSKHVPSNLMSNIWGNFLARPTFKTNSEFLQDFVRAYITIQLLSLCSENHMVSKDFAVKPVKTLLWVTGDLVEIPEFKKLLLSVLDGLQLKGSFDFVCDRNFLMYTFARAFSLGKKSDEVVFTRREFLPNFTKVLAPDIDMKPENRKVVFHGTLFNRRGDSIESFGVSSEITSIEVKNPEHSYLDGKFTKSAYIEKYRKSFEFHCINDDILWDRIVLDCRVKPVVYGPDAKANNIKFNVWFGGESYF